VSDSLVDVDVDVLVVGGGPAGLAASVMLSDFGVDHLVVERHPGTAIAPKAHIINPRTIEIFAQHGFAEDVYEHGSPRATNATTRFFTSLGGDQPWDRQNFHTIDSWSGNSLESYYRTLTPYLHGNWQQNRLEPVLRAHAEERNAGGVRFNHQLTHLSQDDAAAMATVRDRDTDRTLEVRAQYVIAADGGKTVGPIAGVEMVGPPPAVRAISLHFRADLAPYLDQDDSIIRLFSRPALDGGPPVMFGLLAMGPRWDRHSEDWALHIALPLDAPIDPGTAGAQENLGLLRAMLQLPELEAEIVGTSAWLLEAVVADKYQVGRVFFVGDAAHRHSPMGGLGLNSAVQDVHNLTWKLAHVLSGAAAPALLESYEPERRPVGIRNVAFSTGCFYRHLSAGAGFGTLPGAPPEHTQAVLGALFSDTEDGATRRAALGEFYHPLRYEFQAPDIELGYWYGDGAAVAPDGTQPPPSDPTGYRYEQVARPGHRLPHAVLEDESGRRSTHTLIPTGGFVVIAGPSGRPWVDAAAAMASRHGIVIDAHCVGDDGPLRDVDGAWRRLRGHDDDGAILVRPDGHVAFRAVTGHGDPERALGDAVAVALGRG